MPGLPLPALVPTEVNVAVQLALALPDPATSSVAVLHEGCRRVEIWMTETDDLAELDEARHWLAAVETYLAAKNAEGPAQTTARLVEDRIGELLGPAENRGPATVGRDQRFPRRERHDFRVMHMERRVWVHRLPLPRRRVLRLIRDEIADRRTRPEVPAELRCDLRLGAFQDVLADIEDGSLDLILTDPPYPRQYLPLWTELAQFAAAKLAPHGVLAAMTGAMYLPEVIARLGEHLAYRWTMAYLVPGPGGVVYGRNVVQAWKPVLIYGSSNRRLYDVASSRASDKQFHGWGQSESGFYSLLRLLADPGAIVCDPFAGGGTTAVVARGLGCHFIGAEIDPGTYEIAMRRLAP